MDFDKIPTGVDITNADSLERRTTETAQAFSKRISDIEAGIAQKQQRLEADMQERLQRTNPDDRKTLRTLLTRDVEQDIAQTRRDVVELSEQDRAAMLSQLSKAEAEIAVLESLHKSPQQVLARSNSGDPKKTQLMQQLSMGGPAQLETFAELAIATGDRAMASAVLLTIQNLPTKQRPFSPADFAQRVVGTETAQTQERLRGLRSKIAAARDLNNEFTRGRADPTSKISRGIAARNAAKAA